MLVEEIEHALHERLAHAREGRQASKEPRTADQVEAARQRVSAEFTFVGFVESLRQAAHGEVGHRGVTAVTPQGPAPRGARPLSRRVP